jgi:hypothetical protein
MGLNFLFPVFILMIYIVTHRWLMGNGCNWLWKILEVVIFILRSCSLTIPYLCWYFQKQTISRKYEHILRCKMVWDAELEA